MAGQATLGFARPLTPDEAFRAAFGGPEPLAHAAEPAIAYRAEPSERGRVAEPAGGAVVSPRGRRLAEALQTMTDAEFKAAMAKYEAAAERGDTTPDAAFDAAFGSSSRSVPAEERPMFRQRGVPKLDQAQIRAALERPDSIGESGVQQIDTTGHYDAGF